MLVIAAINLQLVSCTATLKNHVWMEGGAVILKLRHRSGREYVNYPRTGNSWFTCAPQCTCGVAHWLRGRRYMESLLVSADSMILKVKRK